MGDGGGEGGVQALHHLCTSWHRIDSAEERRRWRKKQEQEQVQEQEEE